MGEILVPFKKPAALGQDAALALEDYARVTSSCHAEVVRDSGAQVIGIQFTATDASIRDEFLQDIERFFESLASDAADRLGWS